ncbi:WW domain-containing protein [Aphelenchoides besseyi]|nr:WW domain-containing protein [Aphelenchoides besseyi]
MTREVEIMPNLWIAPIMTNIFASQPVKQRDLIVTFCHQSSEVDKKTIFIMDGRRSFFPLLPTTAPQPFIRAPLPAIPIQTPIMLSQANLFAAQAAAQVVAAVQLPNPTTNTSILNANSLPISSTNLEMSEKQVEWIQYFNEEGKPYYHNRVTKVTTWTQPENFKPAPQTSVSSSQSKTSTSGRKNPVAYYHNTETKETTWTKPPDFDDPKPILTQSKLPSVISKSATNNLPSSLSDMEKAMQATLRSLAQTAESPKPAPDPVDPNEMKQRQTEKFRELLLDKYNDGRIKTSMSWDQTLRQIQHDPRFRIITKVSEKKRIFNEWKTQQQKDERDARKLAVRKSKDDFEQFLLNHKKARPEMSYSKAERVFGHESTWKALSESDRRDIYKDTMVLLQRKIESETREKRAQIRRLFTDLLDSLENIEYRTTWAEAQRILSECTEMAENDDLKSMHKLELLESFKDHIRKLEREHVNQREMKDKRLSRSERQIRDAFHELLQEYNQKGIITSTSTWVETFPLFRQDSRFTKMLQQPGSTPLDVFKFFVEDLKSRYHKDRRRIRDILEKLDREVEVETTFTDFEKWIRGADPTNEIDAGNLSLYFRSLIEKAAEKAKDTLKPAPKKMKLDVEAPTVEMFEHLSFNIRSTDRWHDLRPKILADPLFVEHNSEEIERLFYEYIKLLPSEESEVNDEESMEVVQEKDQKKSKEKKSKKSKKKDKKKKHRHHERDQSRSRSRSHVSSHRNEDRRRDRSSERGRRRQSPSNDVMGSIRVQPPSGQSRNLTDVFQYLRFNSVQNRRSNFGSTVDSDDRVALLDDAEQGTAVVFKSSSNYSTPSWVNILDEVNFELTKIKTRKAKLKELQQKHLIRPDFNDDGAHKEQETIKELTEDLTNVFTHCRRLIRVIEESDREPNHSLSILKENVMSALLFDLNNMLGEFRSGQSHYVKQLDSRKRNVDSFLLSSDSHNPYESSFLSQEAAQTDEELTIDQIQQIIANEHMVKEREREVIKISKSILELNTLFKDLATLVVDQGTILDRIDYNVEQTSLRIKAAHRHVQKAYESHKTRKMQIIVILASIAMFLMLLLIHKMDDQATFSAMPKGQENSLLLVSAAFLTVIFTIIGGFIAKLWYDERQNRRARESMAALDEMLGTNTQEGSRRQRRNEERDGDYGTYQPGRRDDYDSEEEGSENEETQDPFGKKIGKKKLAKLEAKAQARAEREDMLAQRAEQKKREEKLREEREAKEKAEAELKKQEAEEERKRREAIAEKEHQEYLKMKEAFSVEEEGFDQVDENETENLMTLFIDHIKKNKAVNIDELASFFKLRVEDTVEKLRYFLSTGQLTGVIDDRGKFIYITQEELDNVAKFVSQRGRISLSDLAEYSNRLISLESVQT